METLKKPVWSEGTFLSQQLFQKWDHFLENAHTFQMRMSQPHFWGLSHLEIDESALLSGRLRIKACVAIFPHGQIVTFNASEDGELCLELHQKQEEILEIFLCVPFSSHIQGLSGYDTKHEFYGWNTHYESISDQYDHRREREVAFALPNLCLLNNHDNRDQYAQIKIVEVVRHRDDQYQLIKQFIPPVIHISANQILSDCLQRILDLLSAKIRRLTDKNEENLLQWDQTELAPLLLLKTLNQHFPVLRSLQQSFVHPWELYKEIVRLLGGLSLFKNNLEIPNYDHNDLTTVFNTLEQKLQLVVHQALPENIVKLPLTKQTDSLYLIDHIEPHLFTKYQFYLAVKMSNHDLTWINRFPQQIKIACQTDIQAVIGSAIPTIPLQHLQRPPNHLPIKNDYEYFQIEQQNEYWHRIAETNNLAIFVSYEFTEVQVEMVAIV